jgi:DNA processing protein
MIRMEPPRRPGAAPPPAGPAVASEQPPPAGSGEVPDVPSSPPAGPRDVSHQPPSAGPRVAPDEPSSERAPAACDECLRRTALIAAIAGRLDVEWRRHDATSRVLALRDEQLIALGEDDARRAYSNFDPRLARERARSRGLQLVCRCDPAYPERLLDLHDPPAVLHIAGRLTDGDRVGIVGARRATPYGLEVARALGRGLSASGVPVVSGLALGVDSASHTGALEGHAPLVAVLAGGADVPYPSSKRALYGQVVQRGCVVSEMPPGFTPMRWCFVARNRIIAALSQVLVVVEAAERSGSLTTADFAAELGRTVGAVPGHITCRLAAGTNGLLQSGAAPITGVRDVLEQLACATGTSLSAEAPTRATAELPEELAALLEQVEAGHGSLAELAVDGGDPKEILAALSELEFRGHVKRTFGGRYEPAV